MDAIESILGDFRAWLQDARETPEPAPMPDMDLATIVQHFTALRQEVNLQTRASRGQLEQNAQTLDRLQQALDTIHHQQDQRKETDRAEQEDLLRPLLKTLLDAHDALTLARREVQRLLDQTALPSAPPVLPAPPTIEIRLPFWARWLGLGASIERQLAPLRAYWAEKPAPEADDSVSRRARQMLDALLTGYQMSVQRLERMLVQQNLEAIPCVGLPFDPETMEVVEVIREEGRTSTQVLEVVRPGYFWNGRLFRYAQVRVAKP